MNLSDEANILEMRTQETEEQISDMDSQQVINEGEDFVKSVNLYIGEVYRNLNIILITLGIFLVSIVFFSFYIIYQIRKMRYNFSIEEMAEELEGIDRVKFHKGEEYNSVVFNLDKNERDNLVIISIESEEVFDFEIEDTTDCDKFIIEKHEELETYKIRNGMRIKIDKEVYYKLFNQDFFHRAEIVDISRNGIQISDDINIKNEVNKVKKLQLDFRNEIPIENKVTGKIKTIKKDGDKVYLGIEFKDFQKKDKENLINWILENKDCN